MAYRKKTLRQMSPTARKVARLTGELQSVSRRLKNLIPELQDLDFESSALKTANSGLYLSDSDLWGLQSALIHCQSDGHLDENKEWVESMLERIDTARDN